MKNNGRFFQKQLGGVVLFPGALGRMKRKQNKTRKLKVRDATPDVGLAKLYHYKMFGGDIKNSFVPK